MTRPESDPPSPADLALLSAACDGDLPRLRELLSMGADPRARAPSGSWRFGRTPLMLAAFKGRADCVAALIAHGDPLAADGWGSAALALAAEMSEPECCRLLAPLSGLDAIGAGLLRICESLSRIEAAGFANAARAGECVRIIRREHALRAALAERQAIRERLGRAPASERPAPRAAL